MFPVAANVTDNAKELSQPAPQSTGRRVHRIRILAVREIPKGPYGFALSKLEELVAAARAERDGRASRTNDPNE